MELLLVKLVALSRPLASMEFGETLFVAAGVGLFGMLVIALLVRIALKSSLRMSGIDWIIVAFTFWCVSISLIYFEAVRPGEVGKLVIPLLSYTLVKNVVRDEREYKSLILWTIAGFAFPTLLSVVLIFMGSPIAVDMVNYWTNVPRWEGVYNHSHTLGHSMTLLLFAIALWMALGPLGQEGARPRTFTLLCVGALVPAAVYCLYMSQVRTALLGLLTFIAIYLCYLNRRLLIVGTAAFAVLAAATAPYWLARLAPELIVQERGIEVGALDVGSGRPRLWLNDIAVFGRLPIDQQIGGVGIGANEQVGDGETLYGHNDWLGMLTQTGIVGFLLFAALQLAIFRRILQMQGKERYLFMALFAAVNVMMLVSNSYAWRIQVSQLYYMMLAFIELPTTRLRTTQSTLQEVRA